MQFFYADALDMVDPRFDFLTEQSPRDRIPQRDDVYAHELLAPQKAYDGLLVSKFLFDLDGGQGRYSQAQRFRFLRQGARRFLRYPPELTAETKLEQWPLLGDCGAFNYRALKTPPYTTDEVIEFYEAGEFTHGVSVDHMIGAYKPDLDQQDLFPSEVPEEYQRRFDLTLSLADEFLQRCRTGSFSFTPIGIAQGWSPGSYQTAVRRLMAMGYDYVALGGLVPLKTPDILDVLAAVRDVTEGKLRLHLFGITRLQNFEAFRSAGVVSLDSASPMRQAFKDARNNYYSARGHYSAVRIPQADKYPKLLKKIRSGELDQALARKGEEACLEGVRALGRGEASVDDVMAALQEYEGFYGGSSKWTSVARTLRDRPWEECPCPVCAEIGIDVVVFRGANRNRRRGFHNLWYTQQLLNQHRSQLEES